MSAGITINVTAVPDSILDVVEKVLVASLLMLLDQELILLLLFLLG